MSTPLFPDPALTASIYCAGRLDAAIFHAVAPFWRELQPHDPERLCHLWLMRYGKGGEHLKVRVHGPESLRPLQRRLLEEKVTGFLISLPALEAPPRKRERAPAIDAEDEDAGGDRPDRTLLWTTYRRSHVSLGGEPFLSDDHYATLFTRCLAAGCEMVCALAADAEGPPPQRTRRNTLLKALIAGLAALGFEAEKRADYLAYHGDWLLRSLLPADQRTEAEPLERLRRRLDEKIAGMGDSFIALRKMAARQWRGGEEADAGWRRSLTALHEYISPLCRAPEYRLDPFASDPTFAPVFKAFHGFANQLGLPHADEAFAHHILLRINAHELP